MISYVIRRLFQAVVVIFGVILIVFLLFHLEPTVVIAKAIVGPRASPVQVQAVIQSLGLDKPLYYQVWRLIDNYVHLDFGTSYQFNTPVRVLIAQALPKTLLLVGTSTIVALSARRSCASRETRRTFFPSSAATSCAPKFLMAQWIG